MDSSYDPYSDANVRRWTLLYEHCDSGLPHTCTHPVGDPRAIIAVLLDERIVVRPVLAGAFALSGALTVQYADWLRAALAGEQVPEFAPQTDSIIDALIDAVRGLPDDIRRRFDTCDGP